MASFEKALADLRDGRITFDEFARDSRGRITSLAAYIARRWQLPAWAALEDLEQELLIGVWRHVWKFEPCMGTPLDRYVVYNAVDAAKKAAHRMRGASLGGSADRNPSRIEAPMATWGDDAARYLDAWLQQPASQEADLALAEDVARLQRRCKGLVERYAVAAVAKTGGNLDAAARALYADAVARAELGLRSEKDAWRKVDRAVARVVAREARAEMST